VVARNSTAALAFENTQDAEVVLSALSADPTITVAALYDAQGQLFALYPRGADRRSLPGAPGATGFRFDGLRAAGFEPVLNGERQLGTLYVRSDLSAIIDRAGLYALIVLVVAMLASLAAYMISRRLRQRLLQPFLALKETAGAVSERQDYSVRAEPTGTLEFDALTDAFNHMLRQIGQSERKLQLHLGRLGLLHRITRAIGDRQDMPSIFDVVLANLEETLLVDFVILLLHER